MIIRGGQPVVCLSIFATPAELNQGVRDVEALCFHTANEYLRRHCAHLDDDLYDEMVGYLMLVAWTEAARYRSVGGTSTLHGYVARRLAWRCTDFFRREFGDNRRGAKRRPVIVSLDALPHDVAATEAV